MRTMWSKPGNWWVAALALTLLAGTARAEEGQAPQSPADVMAAIAAAGQPGAEHQKLAPLAGQWTYTCKFWMDPSQPPLESSGTIERQWILDGRFLQERVQGTGHDGSPGFEGFGLLGYDNGRKVYTSAWACNTGTGTCTGQGTVDEAGTTFTFQSEAYCPVMQKEVTGREVIRIESDDRVVMESYLAEGGSEHKMMEIVATRQR